ncbi:MAG TPA: TetR/AcrR family transcriptional regulator [Polyangiaceae bacterium]|nr:TetR/AcrR family transcriptional regulator [Polyangiaceae bacterium]HMR76616.1 TetR/AcrR family transcriptional regulator [Polyangiaceae bacterium]
MGVAERRQRERKERRQCILDAAERVFLDKGLSSATMEEIAHVAEVSKGTLYLYFKGKDELYLAIAMRALSELLDHFEKARAVGGSGKQRLRGLLSAHVDFAVRHRDRFRVATSWLSSEYSVGDDNPGFAEYKALITQVYCVAVETIELGKQDGTLRPDLDGHVLATQLWGATYGAMTLRANSIEVMRRMPNQIDWDQWSESFVDLMLLALGNPEQPSDKELS